MAPDPRREERRDERREERRDERRRARLDQPYERRAVFGRPRIDPEVFGRWAEDIARFFGTARYLAVQTVLVVLWIAYNVTAAHFGITRHRHHGAGWLHAFDPYPFILLNLAFSTQAAYAAPLILLAQGRQADRDRVSLEEDRARNERTIADTEYLTREVAALRIALGDVATRDFVRSELQRLLEELTGERGVEPDKDGVGDKRVG